MLRPRGLCGLEAKLFGLGLGLVVSGLGLGLVASDLGLIEVGLVNSEPHCGSFHSSPDYLYYTYFLL